jgi:hypothetical protein
MRAVRSTMVGPNQQNLAESLNRRSNPVYQG